MRAFSCEQCRSSLYFENAHCLTCGSTVAYSRAARRMVVVSGPSEQCVNLTLSGCNWLVEHSGDQCFSCNLTRTRPADNDAEGLAGYYTAEQAKRRLVYELDDIGLPVERRVDDQGLAFDLLSSSHTRVVTGHADGLITIDLAESNDAHREQLRLSMDEVYRTMLGHFRHESGHYYESVLVIGASVLERCRELFGDDTVSYQDALDRHYSEGAPDGWESSYISKYATMHPFEDFAETFAHFLHIRDTLQTAHEHGVAPDSPDGVPFAEVVRTAWIPLSVALNQINRSMGKGPLYPFVLAPPVIEKLSFVADLVNSSLPAREQE